KWTSIVLQGSQDLMDLMVLVGRLSPGIGVQSPDLLQDLRVFTGGQARARLRCLVSPSVFKGYLSSKRVAQNDLGSRAQVLHQIKEVICGGRQAVGCRCSQGFTMVAQIEEHEAVLGARRRKLSSQAAQIVSCAENSMKDEAQMGGGFVTNEAVEGDHVWICTMASISTLAPSGN